MRRGICVSVFILAICPASAADWYTGPRARPPRPIYSYEPPQTWEGGYTGANAGGAISISKTSFSTAPLAGDPLTVMAAGLATTSVSPTAGSFIAGLQTGYNYQNGSLVAGVEADVQFAVGRGTKVRTNSGAFSLGSIGPFQINADEEAAVGSWRSLHYLATLRGRLGFIVAPSFLIYGTGGVAFGQTQFRFAAGHLVTLQIPGYGSASAIGDGGAIMTPPRAGWTAGVGFEWMFARNWSAKFEYLYYDLGSVSASFPLAMAGDPYAMTKATARANGEIFRAGVNYHFR
jgi:outer membrane immunogenic protein